MMGNRQKIYDVEGLLNNEGLITSSGAGKVDGSAKEFDTGGGFTEGVMVINCQACEVDTGDEKYTVKLQGTNTEGFTGNDIVDIVAFEMGDATQLVGDADVGVGIYNLPFNNFLNDTTYRYLRAYTVVAGTVATGINNLIYLSK